MPPRSAWCLAALAVVMTPLTVAAQGYDSPACKADFERLCPGVQPGEGRLFQCISKHLDQLSLECRSQAHEGHQQMHATASAPSGTCMEDAQKFCSHVPHGSGGLFDCLEEKYLALAPGCQLLVQNMIQRIERVKAACKGDIEKLCTDKSVPLIPCLGANVKALSEGCRATFTEGARPPAAPPAAAVPATTAPAN